MFSANGLVSIVLLGVLLMPSSRILDHHRRTHRRHATCEHHLRHHHSEPAERARVIRRAERRMRRQQERARIEEARRGLQALDESELQTVQAAADPLDDSNLKKGRRKGKMRSRFWDLQEPPKVKPAGEFLALLQLYLEDSRAQLSRSADPLPHYGSGPCHSIPRPREGTTSPLA